MLEGQQDDRGEVMGDDVRNADGGAPDHAGSGSLAGSDELEVTGNPPWTSPPHQGVPSVLVHWALEVRHMPPPQVRGGESYPVRGRRATWKYFW